MKKSREQEIIEETLAAQNANEQEFEEENREVEREIQLAEQLIRMAADFENFKRRERENIKRARQDGRIEVIEKVIPLVDTLAKAAAMITDPQTKQGINMLAKQFVANLETLGVVKIDALGEVFNANLHNVVLTEGVTDKKLIDTVLEVYSAGYMMDGRVLRYADVKIGK